MHINIKIAYSFWVICTVRITLQHKYTGNLYKVSLIREALSNFGLGGGLGVGREERIKSVFTLRNEEQFP